MKDIIVTANAARVSTGHWWLGLDPSATLGSAREARYAGNGAGCTPAATDHAAVCPSSEARLLQHSPGRLIFLQRDNPIRFEIGEPMRRAAGPADLDRIDLGVPA